VPATADALIVKWPGARCRCGHGQLAAVRVVSVNNVRNAAWISCGIWSRAKECWRPDVCWRIPRLWWWLICRGRSCRQEQCRRLARHWWLRSNGEGSP